MSKKPVGITSVGPIEASIVVVSCDDGSVYVGQIAAASKLPRGWIEIPPIPGSAHEIDQRRQGASGGPA